jgi:flagellar biosynthesis protein FlhA
VATTIAHPKAALPLIAKYSDAFVAVAAVLILGMMIVPLPEWFLDVLLTLNITMALAILLVTVYVTEPLQFSSFPSMLLLTVLFRLSLNIAATRLILVNASAGAVISAFGTVVVGGNYVVGIVIFAILVIVQFVVITNGTSRVAEVAARFTLDAMPGKQMAIDADLNAGLIDEKEARRRRSAVSRAADFYGAMDGSSKFVRGDSIAAIIMIIVNIIGGFIVGVAQRHMDFMAALQTYTLLTVGMGLVTQIPGLLVSSAAGLMVTKTASEGNLGSEVAGQIFSQPKALMTTAGICGVLALIPGLPKLPFLLIAAGGYWLGTTMKNQAAKPLAKPASETAAQAPKSPESMTDLLTVDPIEIELGYGLIPLADPKQGGDLLERITAVRRQAALDLGLLVPAIRVRDNMQLNANTYVMKLRGVEIAHGDLYVGHLLAMNSTGAATPLQGINTTEPAFGLPATWISEIQQSEAELAGYTVVDPLTVLITHVTEVLRKNAAEILTRQDTQTLIDAVKAKSPAIVSELIPDLLTLGDVQKVLQNLLVERVSVRDMATILEALSDGARITKDPDALTEYVRQALCRQITSQWQGADGTLHVFTLDPSVEQIVADGIRQLDTGAQLVLEPGAARKILAATKDQTERMAALGYQPVALCSPRTRVHFRRLVERMASTLAVLSFNELASTTRLETVGMVELTNENAQN